MILRFLKIAVKIARAKTEIATLNLICTSIPTSTKANNRNIKSFIHTIISIFIKIQNKLYNINMKFNRETFEKIEAFVSHYKEEIEEKNRLIELLKKYITEVQPSFFEKIKTPPEYNFAIFNENFTYSPIRSFENPEYTVLATDGSRMTLDEVFSFPFYVINVASIFQSIGKESRHEKDNKFEIYFKEQDLFNKSDDTIAEEDIDLKMLIKEAQFLSEKISVYNPDFSLVDGSLILWGIKKVMNLPSKNLIEEYEKPIIESYKRSKPIAGYISGPRSKEVIKSLRLYLQSNNIRFNEQLIKMITDAELLDSILEVNSCSSIFTSTEKLLDSYTYPIHFFFLKTSYELVRIEVPEFVCNNKETFNNFCSMLLFEIERGKGYPLALKLAHFEAVIGEDEKKFIENYIEKRIKNFKSSSMKKYFKMFKKI